VKPGATQQQIRVRVRALANRGQPENTTRLKYVLPHLRPTTRTNGVLWKVLVGRPDLADTITRHFDKYTKLPNSLADVAISEVLSEGVYHSVNAELLNLMFGRIQGARLNQVADFCYERLFVRRLPLGGAALAT
jgi:hypothetical protein